MWNEYANGAYSQPKCLAVKYPAVQAITMICRSTCCDQITTKNCKITICSRNYFTIDKYVCSICQQISCKHHYSEEILNFVCDACEQLGYDVE